MQRKLAKGTAVKILVQQPMQVLPKHCAATRKYNIRKIRCSSSAIVFDGEIGRRIIIGVTNDAPIFCTEEMR